MKPFVVALLASFASLAPHVASARELPPQVQAVLKQIKAVDKDMLAGSGEDGRFMRLLVATSRSKRALEIGTASGYSAIWIGMGLPDPGGQPGTIEYDNTRAQAAVANIKQAGPS